MPLRLNLTSLKIEDRITPSDRRSGVWIEAALAFGFTIGGIIGFIIVFFGMIMPQWRLIKEYQETSCTIVDFGVASMQNRSLYRPQIRIRYSVPTPIRSDKSGKTFLKKYDIWTYDYNTLCNSGYFYQKDEAYELLKPFHIGEKVVCYYDPQNPQKAVLFRNWSWTNITLLIVPISLFLLGLGPLIHLYMYRTGRSQGSVVHNSEVSHNTISDNSEDASPETTASDKESLPIESFPNSPSVRNIIDSPGVKMKYRLPLENSPIRSLGILLILCIAWGVLCIYFVSVALGGFLDKKPDLVLTGFILPFFLVWIGLFFYFFRNVQLAASIPPTLMEINEALLHPGQTTSALVIQMGGRYFFKLDVNLICEEEAAFSYGTDIRSEKMVVYCSNLISEKDFNIVVDEQFEKTFEFTIPEDAMHSFDSPHNRISWRLEVSGEAENYPPFTRSFTLVVNPSNVLNRNSVIAPLER